MGSSASLDRSPRKNWVENSGSLPRYVREVARSIERKRGVPLSRAIAIAIGVMKNWASGRGDVSADTRAKAAKAVAEWEALKAKNRARTATAHTPTVHVDTSAAELALARLRTRLDRLALAQETPMANCPTCGVDGAALALAVPPALAKANAARKATPPTNTPAAAKSTVQVPQGQEEQFKQLVARILKRPGMTREKAEKAAAAILRNRKAPGGAPAAKAS